MTRFLACRDKKESRFLNQSLPFMASDCLRYSPKYPESGCSVIDMPSGPGGSFLGIDPGSIGLLNADNMTLRPIN